ncbi:hypothetical protein D3C71_1890160 [compost metagenome]
MDEFVSEQKQSLAFSGLDPALDFVRTAVTEKTGNISFRCCRFAAAHEQLKDVLPDHFLLFHAGIFFAQTIKALNIALLIEDHNYRVSFRNHLFGKG